MYNITGQTPVIQFTKQPKLLLARYDGERPDDWIVQLFGTNAKVLCLKDVWPEYWVEETVTVIGDINLVVIALSLVINDNEEDGASHETVMELADLVSTIKTNEPGLLDYIFNHSTPSELLKPKFQLDLAVLKEEIQQFILRIECL